MPFLLPAAPIVAGAAATAGGVGLTTGALSAAVVGGGAAAGTAATGLTLGQAGLAFTALGAGHQAISAARTASFNAEIAGRNAQIERERAEFQEKQKRASTKKLLSRQRAIIGKSGLDIAGFQPVIEETVALEELDALAIRRGGDINVQNELLRADLFKKKSRDAITTGVLDVGSTLLTGGSRLLRRSNRGLRLN